MNYLAKYREACKLYLDVYVEGEVEQVGNKTLG